MFNIRKNVVKKIVEKKGERDRKLETKKNENIADAFFSGKSNNNLPWIP